MSDSYSLFTRAGGELADKLSLIEQDTADAAAGVARLLEKVERIISILERKAEEDEKIADFWS